MIILFAGPSLYREPQDFGSDIIVRGPAAQGDIYQAARGAPWGIGLIDGYFHRVPAVWHKEILWALSRGVHVYGAASMGALRAAELHSFGMIGVGEIFEGFKAGLLEDDDEVALVHASAEHGHRPLSDAMADIRANAHGARRAGLIGEATAARMIDSAKALFYPERSYARVLSMLREAATPRAELKALETWLEVSRVDQKRSDARALIARMRADRDRSREKCRVTFHFPHTHFFVDGIQNASDTSVDAGSSEPQAARKAILDELRLRGEGAYHAAITGALARALAVGGASPGARTVDTLGLSKALEAFRRERGLFEEADVLRWLGEHDLDADGFADLMRDEAVLEQVTVLHGPEIEAQVLSYLRLRGQYKRLAARALDKEQRLSKAGAAAATPEPLPLPESELVGHYFRDVLSCEPPRDLPRYARRLGLETRAAFVRLLAREWAYQEQICASN